MSATLSIFVEVSWIHVWLFPVGPPDRTGVASDAQVKATTLARDLRQLLRWARWPLHTPAGAEAKICLTFVSVGQRAWV